MLIEAFKQLNINLEIKYWPSKRGFMEAKEGSLDGVVGRIYSAQYLLPSLHRLKIPIAQFDGSVFSFKNKIKIKKFSDLRPYRIGILNGDVWSTTPTNNGFTRKICKDHKKLYQLLKYQRIDYALADKRIFMKVLPTKFSKEITIHSPPLIQHKLYAYINLRFKKLIPKIEKQLLLMKESGEIDNIIERSFSRHAITKSY